MIAGLPLSVLEENWRAIGGRKGDIKLLII